MNEVRILVVDDEPVTRIITETVLRGQGFVVRSTESAEAAFAALAGGFAPQLILLDVVMPGMSGYEACRRLRTDPRYEHLPIVMLTSLDDQKSIDEAYFSGATDFFTKPLNMPLLPHRVRHLLRSAMTFQQLLDSRETLLTTQRLASLGDWEVDGDGTLVNCSAQYREILGVGSPPRPAGVLMARVHREDRARLEAARAGLACGVPYQLDYRLTGRDGSFTHLHEVGYPNPAGAGGGYGYTQDITQRVVAEEQVRQLAWYDPLTGLKNRSRMAELMPTSACRCAAVTRCRASSGAALPTSSNAACPRMWASPPAPTPCPFSAATTPPITAARHGFTPASAKACKP